MKIYSQRKIRFYIIFLGDYLVIQIFSSQKFLVHSALYILLQSGEDQRLLTWADEGRSTATKAFLRCIGEVLLRHHVVQTGVCRASCNRLPLRPNVSKREFLKPRLLPLVHVDITMFISACSTKCSLQRPTLQIQSLLSTHFHKNDIYICKEQKHRAIAFILFMPKVNVDAWHSVQSNSSYGDAAALLWH